MRALFVLALLLAAIPAAAAEWVYTSMSKNNEKLYVDTSSIRTDSTGATSKKLVWIKMISPAYIEGVRTMSLEEYDCMGRYRIIQRYIIFTDGTQRDEGKLDWTYIPPDTVPSNIAEFVCK